jgi:hypothetical protein
LLLKGLNMGFFGGCGGGLAYGTVFLFNLKGEQR